MALHHKTGWKLAALTSIAALALAACSDDESSGGGSEGGSGTITLGVAAPESNPLASFPEIKAGAEAAAAKINADGGVNGAQIKINFCDTNVDPNQEVNCARQFVKDKVTAVVYPLFLVNPSGAQFQVLEAANIPAIGTGGTSPAEYNSPVAFPLSSGMAGYMYGNVYSLVNSGSTKISVLGDNQAQTQANFAAVEEAMNTAGLKPVQVVPGDPTTDPTFATAASKAIAGGVDGVIAAGSPNNLPKMVTALRQAGYTGTITASSGNAPGALLKALGNAAEGMLITSMLATPTDTANTGVEAFLADMKQYQPDAQINEQSEFAWAATKLFADVAADIEDINAQKVLDAMNDLSDPVDLGVTAPYSVVGKESPTPINDRITNPTVYINEVKNGEVMATTGEPVDPFAELAKK
ncbi:ABC transporter substrate-binding protein [Williamsia soli]|uniref:ABC transporter substrate-binding protein n=1 Tax=Williamsia soli TaxID=364929 RepID=UPI001A9E1AA8|nr:ABC transporter substrate-binding protein [Williamsia soli]